MHPLGLATKGPRWYLVADTDAGMRTFRVDRVTSVEPTGEPVVRPDGFDLAESWRLIVEEVDQLWAAVRARGTVAPGSVSLLRGILGSRLRIGPTTADGRVEVEVGGPSLRALAGELAGFGALVEFVEPPELRGQLAAIAAELTATYG